MLFRSTELRGKVAMLKWRQRLILEEEHVVPVQCVENLVSFAIGDACAQVDPRHLRTDGGGDLFDDHAFTIPVWR